MAFSRRKGTGSDSSKRSRLSRGASRDPFAHLSEERARAEEGEPWFLAAEEEDESDLQVQAGISSNLKPEDLALLQEAAVEPPPAPGELELEDQAEAPPPPASDHDPYGPPGIAPGAANEPTSLPSSDAGPRSSMFDLPETREAIGEPLFEADGTGAPPPPEPEMGLGPDVEPDVGRPAEPERRAHGALDARDTLTHPVVDQTSVLDPPEAGGAYAQPPVANAPFGEPGAGLVADHEAPAAGNLLEDADREEDAATDVFPDVPTGDELPIAADLPPEPLEPVDASVFHELDAEMAEADSEDGQPASFVIDVESREEEDRGGDWPPGSESSEGITPAEEEPLRNALLQSFRDVVARAPASPEIEDLEDDDYDPKHRRPETEVAEQVEGREVRPRKPPARPRRF